MKKVLLFGSGLQVLSVAWSLKDRYMVEACAEDISVIRHCRSLSRCYAIRLETLDPGRLFGYDAVIPMEDPYAEWLAKHREAFGGKAAVMDAETFSLVSDKMRLMDFCARHGFPHPKTMPLDLVDAAVDSVGFPSLVKPDRGGGSRGIRLVHDREELDAVLPAIRAEYGSCSLQEYISDRESYYNVMLYRCRDGSWGNYAVTHILRYYPIKGGSSSLCVTVEEPRLVQICQSVLESLDWVGFADFDVLEKGDGDYRIIEINPRVPASIRAAEAAGVSFGDLIVSDLLGEPLPVYTYKPGRYLRCLGLDLAWFFHSPRRWSARPSWFRFFRGTVYQDGGWRDFPAMAAYLRSGIGKWLDPAFRRKKSGMN